MKRKTKIILWIMLVAVFIATIVCSIFIKDNSNLFTMISGWISGIATIVLGLIAVFQNKYYKKVQDDLESRIDVIVENVIDTSNSIEKNFMYRLCDSTKTKCCMYYLHIRSFNYLENPIFDIGIKQMICPDKQIVLYDNIQPINKDQYGRSVLTKDNLINISVPLPMNYLEGEYKLEFYMENMNGEKFKKEISISMANNRKPYQCYNLKQKRSIKINEGNSNEQITNAK